MAIAIGSPNKVKLGKVRKSSNRVTSDEPADSLQGSPRANAQNENPSPKKRMSVQGGADNPGRTPLQNDKAVMSPQGGSQSVNAKPEGGGLKAQISRAMFGKKKKSGK